MSRAPGTSGGAAEVPASEVRVVFLAALAADPPQREQVIARATTDPGVRAAVGRLLAHDERAAAAGFLAQSAFGPSLRPGQAAGRYRVVRPLGEGGMGEVYLVESPADGTRYALKVIRRGMDTRRLVARFELEQRTLARLRHPAIARIVDFGCIDDGQPYFVMEYVDGAPIDRFCGSRGLGLAARLRLFAAVCAAVQHAHQHGVIHRDLKPSNILVTSGPEGPTAKVIDFGLAKVIGSENGGSSTELGRIVGTPEFMSPEQLDGGSRADTRADVYSLGAVLYVLLTGTPPLADLREDGDERMRQRIRDELPERPSLRVGAAAAIAPRLRGELDWIAAKALAKEPAARYRSVAEFADDVRAHLRGDPVRARPPSPWYSARKFVARHRAVVAAVGLAAALGIAGLVSTSLALVEAEAAQRTAQDRLRAFNLLGYRVQLERATVEEHDLYPAWPRRAGALRQWLDEHAAPLLQVRDDVHAALMEVRAGALPYDAVQRRRDAERFREHRDELARLTRRRDALRLAAAASPAEGSRRELLDLERRMAACRQILETRGSYSFGSESDHVLHDGLARLSADLRAFTAPDHGLVARVRERWRWSRRVHALSIERHAANWERARREVVADPRFAGFALAPQLGLVPLGADRRSGLQEFAHLRSGAVPRREADGRLEDRADGGIVFVLLPGGEFAMGAPPCETTGLGRATNALGDEAPVHRVALAPFLLAKHELTQAQAWRLGPTRPSAHGDDAHPVENLSWPMADRLLRRHGLRLPTEAQWEYACRPSAAAPRSGDGIVVPGGLAAPHRPVSATAANALGVHGMIGNVAEWCADGYGSYTLATRARDGLRELAADARRVVRGAVGQTRPTARESRHPASRDAHTGVRAARALDP
ncbi:MAG: bifunctional serine/threonine-protein kinase/formylglycine-generating enzyme family protein [Planctomycetota bacterium]